MKPVLLFALVGCLGAHTTCAENVACPSDAAYNGCMSKRCIMVTKASGQQAKVCDSCGVGYQLMYQGTALARCDCAPGFGVWVNGKYTNHICQACPEGTDLAPGGTKLSATCLTCPESTTVGLIQGKKDCVCPAGSYRAAKARPGTGFKPVECKVCTSLKTYTSVEDNALARCSVCGVGKVANKSHTGCVAPTDPDAAEPSATDGTISTLNVDPLTQFSS